MERMEKVIGVFLYNKKLKFNEIEKLTKIRSNKLTYYLKELTKKRILEKDKEYYKLTEASESLIPYVSNKKSPLPIVLIHIGNNKQAHLIKREKRPFKDLLSLPGGRLLVNESISKAVKRIMKEKYNISAKFEQINSITLEHVKKNKTTIHTFLLILVSAITKDKIQLTDIQKSKSKIISSDYKLIKNKQNSEINIKTIYSKD